MLKDVISKLDYSNFDEFALLLFAASFIAIVWGAFRLSKEAADRFSAIPLSDAIQDPVPTNGDLKLTTKEVSDE